MRSISVATVFAVLTLVSTRASAESVKASCAHNAEAAQRLRDDGKPLAARAKLLACARPACPGVIVTRCARWLEDVDAAIPTVVIKASAAGADVTNVAVFIDDTHAPAVASLDGRPLRVEPGGHTMRYVRAGAVVEARVVLAAGEKNRLLAVEFPSPGAPPVPVTTTAAAAPAAPPPGADSPRAGAHAGPPTMAWVLGGVALAAAGSFAYFGATGRSDLASLRASCGGHCDEAPVNAAWNKLIIADVSLGVGVVALGAATWLALSSRHEPADAVHVDATALVVQPSARGVSLGWRGVF